MTFPEQALQPAKEKPNPSWNQSLRRQPIYAGNGRQSVSERYS
jgi:hypothetical protein